MIRIISVSGIENFHLECGKSIGFALVLHYYNYRLSQDQIYDRVGGKHYAI